MSLPLGLPPRRTRLPRAWSDALPELVGVGGPSEDALVARLEEGELSAVAVEGGWNVPGEPAEGWPGLVVGAVPARVEPRDLLLPAEGSPTLASLEDGARVALAGARRRALLAAHRPGLRAVSLPDRAEETVGPFLRGGGAEAAIVGAHEARAAGLSDTASDILEPGAWTPAPGQGAWTLLARADDEETRAALTAVHHPATLAALEAEAAVGRALGLGPGAALGVLALPYGRWLRVWAMLLSPDGRRVVRADLSGSDLRPTGLGREVAATLRERGADRVAQRTS